MNKLGKLIPAKIKMLHFTILSGSINCPDGHSNENVENFEFDVDFNLGFNLDENLVKTKFKFKVETESKNQEEATGNFHFVYWFEVENLDELVIKGENDKELVSPQLGNALASITYSTSRGILMTRFQGTALSNFILPVVDPNELLK
ncbi:MAG: hypothetical protein RJQ00_02720 [Vicingaceae bacterium]